MPALAPSTFNGFDWLLLLILVVSTLTAFLRGIIKVLLSLVGLVVGIVAASWYYQPFARKLAPLVSSFPVAEAVAFLVIAVGIMVLFTLLANLLRRTANAIGLGFFDRLFGAAFGFLRGCVLGSAIMLAVLAFVPGSAWIGSSRLAPYFLAGAHTVSFIVPEGLQRKVSAGALLLLDQAPSFLGVPGRTHP